MKHSKRIAEFVNKHKLSIEKIFEIQKLMNLDDLFLEVSFKYNIICFNEFFGINEDMVMFSHLSEHEFIEKFNRGLKLILFA